MICPWLSRSPGTISFSTVSSRILAVRISFDCVDSPLLSIHLPFTSDSASLYSYVIHSSVGDISIISSSDVSFSSSSESHASLACLHCSIISLSGVDAVDVKTGKRLYGTEEILSCSSMIIVSQISFCSCDSSLVAAARISPIDVLLLQENTRESSLSLSSSSYS